MTKKKVHLFVFDGFSDWEPSYVLPEINSSEDYTIQTFSLTNLPIKSQGGLTVIPDATISSFDLNNSAMLILPGGYSWEKRKLRELIPVVYDFRRHGIPVAAICGATALLADIGLLDTIKHTSNALFYLKMYAPNYKGERNYVDQPAITSENFITANGTAPIEFAKEIFTMLGIYDNLKLDNWYQLYKNGIWA
jgi:putative intracellular protease/amidase